MTNTNVPVKDLSTRTVPPATASALGLALCATFTTGSAHAMPIAVDIIPDVTLDSTTSYSLIINGQTKYFFSQTSGTVDIPGEIPIVGPFTQNEVNTFTNEVGSKFGTFADALQAGETIDASKDFGTSTSMILSGVKPEPIGSYGEFFESGIAYLGLRFDLSGNPHFGWVEINGGDENNLVLMRYGYECASGQEIAAGAGTVGATCGLAPPPGTVPEPGTLALLIAGAASVLAMRRRQRAR